LPAFLGDDEHEGEDSDPEDGPLRVVAERTRRNLERRLRAAHIGRFKLDAAILEAIARGVPHPNAVRLALDHRRQLRNEAPPVAVHGHLGFTGIR
jgi:hypothetical protein